MKKREADFGKLFRHWIKAHRQPISAAYELKQTLKDSIPFSDVQEHQIDALFAVKQKQLLYKLPDDSRGIKPFDYVYLAEADAYVVIKYPDCFVMISPTVFVSEKQKSTRKSLTSLRAREIASLVVEL